jgi:hypothetical protein
MDADVREVLEAVDAFYTGPEKWWGDGKTYDERPRPGGSRCIWQAVDNQAWLYARAKRDHYNGQDIRDRVLHTLGFQSMSNATDWNDAPERTFDDIKRRLAVTLKEAVE